MKYSISVFIVLRRCKENYIQIELCVFLQNIRIIIFFFYPNKAFYAFLTLHYGTKRIHNKTEKLLACCFTLSYFYFFFIKLFCETSKQKV